MRPGLRNEDGLDAAESRIVADRVVHRGLESADHGVSRFDGELETIQCRFEFSQPEVNPTEIQRRKDLARTAPFEFGEDLPCFRYLSRNAVTVAEQTQKVASAPHHRCSLL